MLDLLLAFLSLYKLIANIRWNNTAIANKMWQNEDKKKFQNE